MVQEFVNNTKLISAFWSHLNRITLNIKLCVVVIIGRILKLNNIKFQLHVLILATVKTIISEEFTVSCVVEMLH